MATTITIFITIAVAMITFSQWITANNKLAVDVFDKRMEWFLELRKIVSEIHSFGAPTNKSLMSDLYIKSKFLFGQDVHNIVDRMTLLTFEVETGDPHAVKKLYDAYQDELLPLLIRYMAIAAQPKSNPISEFRDASLERLKRFGANLLPKGNSDLPSRETNS